MASKSMVIQVLTGLQHLPNCPITDANVDRIIDQYEYDLADISDAILAAAADHYRTTAVFFPGSGALREKATEIFLAALDVPTALEAWAQVISAIRFVDSCMCNVCVSTYAEIEGKIGRAYWDALDAYARHTENCQVYQQGGFKEVYSSKIVKDIVEEMGGRDRLLTDNLTADRSQFIRGYNERITAKIKRATMAAPVKQVVSTLAGDYKLLADTLAAK